MLNKFSGIGRLSADPESRFTQSGTQVANFTLCCESGWGDNKHTEFVRCVVWDKLAKVVTDYLSKGSMAYIEGPMQTKKWQDQSGNDRYTTEIIVREMKMLSPKNENQGESGPSTGYEAPSTGEDLPF